MTEMDKLKELDAKEKEALDKYRKSVERDGIGESKFLKVMAKCLNERYKILQYRASQFSDKLDGVK